jgi:hypothetical protein
MRYGLFGAVFEFDALPPQPAGCVPVPALYLLLWKNMLRIFLKEPSFGFAQDSAEEGTQPRRLWRRKQ